MLSLDERVRIAYKKLKASLFFDKTQLPLRDKITTFEDEKIEDKLDHLCEALSSSEKGWKEYEHTILKSVGTFVFPKKLVDISEDTVIFNSDCAPITMEKSQFFIDLSVAGHILSVLWILSIGRKLDRGNDSDGNDVMYEHSYGNRLKKDLVKPETGEITWSPGLFEPYFAQYESWRDQGLKRAEKRLDDKQDALILTLDFKSFYYSADLRRKDFDLFLSEAGDSEKWIRRVNDFVFDVICRYSEKLREINADPELRLEGHNVLPIGFLPSNILANWILTPFDDAVIRQWNPVYYGRYVDDVIIVDKVEKNSPLYKRARNKRDHQRLSSKEIISMFLMDSADILNLSKENMSILNIVEEKSGEPTYRINPKILQSPDSDIRIQNSKAKVFYFQSGATRALLKCFQTKIAQNASEFRLMPDLDSVLINKNYSEIFNLKTSDSINKLRSVTGVELDKFALSKFLGKYRKVSGMINSKEENVFEKDLMMILDGRTLIENYGAWERIFEILVVNDRIDLFEKLAKRIVDALECYEVPQDKVCADLVYTHDGLLRVLRSALCRTSALVWGEKIDKAINNIWEKFRGLAVNSRYMPGATTDFGVSSMRITRLAYCRTRMVNKYVLPLPIDCVLPLLDNGSPRVRLYDLSETKPFIDEAWNDTQKAYQYYPYMVAPHELSFALICADIQHLKSSFNPIEQGELLRRLFIRWNYPNVNEEEHGIYEMEEVQIYPFHNRPLLGNFVTKINNSQKNRLCVAIGNAELNEKDFIAALDRKPNRSYQRYRDFFKMFNAAVEEKIDLLVFPENYLPFEWLPAVSRLCANNQIALITGIEHIVVPAGGPGDNDKDYAYNLTATILPYEHDDYKFAYVAYHNKVEYSPEEIRQIEGHGCTYEKGLSYQLFCWHDIWFPVYCCFELASIHDRALFQSYSDLTVAVEWNKDISYFSNIIESLCRDLHCYCIQANSSGPGDSRVLCPSKTEQRDIIKTKGGKNRCILATDIDIKSLRDFQMLEYELQKDQRSFKPTPPEFNKDILRSKRDGTLFDRIKAGDF